MAVFLTAFANAAEPDWNAVDEAIAMFMGDLVLTDTQLSTVMALLIGDGVEITAIHNHLIRTSVPVFYMHVGGRGDPIKLARGLKAALDLTNVKRGS